MRGTGATQSSGRSRGNVGVTPTGVEIGIDIGIGQIGISTDYGGGIVLGIGGQKIVWGREGGKIHYNIGGFEVTVEARNCVVVETRKIAGIVVGTHVYPDPGCKKPPSEPEKPRPPLDPNPDDPSPIEVPDLDISGWVFLHIKASGYSFAGQFGEGLIFRKILSPIEERIPRFVGRAPLKLSSQVIRKAPTSYTFPEVIIEKNGVQLFVHQIPIYDPVPTRDSNGFLVNTEIMRQDASSIYFTGDKQPLFFWGNFRQIRKFIKTNNTNNQKIKSLYPKSYSSITEYIPFACIPYTGTVDTPPPLPSAGNQPPMPDRCCEALKADIEEIREVLAVPEILAGKLTWPWKMRMPGGQGEEVIMDYPSLIRAVAQMIDHLGIHPPKLSIKDANNAIAGNQSLDNQFPSATQAFEALMSQVWDSNSDVDTLTNFLYRLSWLNVQQSMNMAKVSAQVQVISDMLGGETEPSETAITTPFNIGAGVKEKSTKGKGFGKTKTQNTIDSKIDANTEIVTESLLPDFLKIRENPIVIERYSGGADLNDKIDMIILKLESLQRG
jgi:hypothetical protein